MIRRPSFEYATAEDPSLNYCLWPYQPQNVVEDKFRSINMLYQSFELAGLDERVFALVDAIRDAIGPFRTVFGIKLVGDRLAWEFYFYDYARRQRRVSVARVLDAAEQYLPCGIRPNENLPYFMFSLDIDNSIVTGQRPLDVVQVYVGNPGSAVSSGIAYGVRADSTTLENFYFFFDADRELAEVAGKISSSAMFDDILAPIETVLLPELRRCRTICLANKQTHDCIYFSGITVDQLQWFLDRFGYPVAITEFVRSHRDDLDHLLFDVGYDYRMEDGKLRILKSGYYGVF